MQNVKANVDLLSRQLRDRESQLAKLTAIEKRCAKDYNEQKRKVANLQEVLRKEEELLKRFEKEYNTAKSELGALDLDRTEMLHRLETLQKQLESEMKVLSKSKSTPGGAR